MSKFQPGKSGNPGGRPKEVAELKELAREHAETAINRLVYWLSSDNPKASVASALALLERGFGKPEGTTNLNVNYTFTDILNEVERIRAGRVGADRGGVAEGPASIRH
jgi:hypothetical protein